jgi:hypothetical protein
MSKTQPAPAAPTQFLMLREGSAAKLGRRSSGPIGYQLLTDADQAQFYLRISTNASGGYFSREAVPLTAIRRCLDARNKAEPLRAVALRTAFVSRSINNAGFLAAAMVAEGLLTRDAEKPAELIDAGQWSAWEEGCRALAAKAPMVQVEVGGEAAKPDVPAAVVEGDAADAGKASKQAKPKASKKKSAAVAPEAAAE